VVLDTSAVLCVLLHEPEAPQIAASIAAAPSCAMSAVTWFESLVVLTARKGLQSRAAFDTLIAVSRTEIVPVDAVQSGVAYGAWLQYGKGRDPAGLNLGDCFSYALAKQRAEPLLFKGEDFRRTDIAAALP